MNESEELTAIEYINMLEPDHYRTSCMEGESYNSAFRIDGVLYEYCNRCTLFEIMKLSKTG